MSTAERKERERIRRRNEIIDAAEKLFFAKGFENVTMDDIARETELARGTLYLYFRNRDDILVAIAIRGVKLMNRMYREAYGKEQSGIGKLRQLLYASYEFGNKYPGYYGTLMYLQVNGFVKKDFADKAELAGSFQENSRMLLDSIGEGIKDGTIRADTDPVKAGLYFTASINSVISLGPATGGQDEFVEYSIGMMLRSIENN
jgi:AcrR family transcriptional regulator